MNQSDVLSYLVGCTDETFTDLVTRAHEYRSIIWETEDRMLKIGGKQDSFRCECGSNVFRRSVKGNRYRCNGCGIIYQAD